MANPRHLKVVLQGAHAIREWRSKNPSKTLDLSGADLYQARLKDLRQTYADSPHDDWDDRDEFCSVEDDLVYLDLSEADLFRTDLARAVGRLVGNQLCLDGADLSGSDLSGANLKEVTFCRANLRGANLREANLNRADLSRAKLMKANLGRADLTGADLSEADLTGAFLPGTNLSGVRLRGTIFNRVQCGWSVFRFLDLSRVKGLDTVLHLAPSSVDVATLYNSSAKIQVKFLRGCGVPETLIEDLDSYIARGDFCTCFISYSSKDRKFAELLGSRLSEHGVRVWIDISNMRAGRKSIDQIAHAIRGYDKFLLVLSTNSMQSPWVQTEISIALKTEKDENRQKLFPIGLAERSVIKQWTCFDADTGIDLAKAVREYHIPDFSNGRDKSSDEKGFRELLKGRAKGSGVIMTNRWPKAPDPFLALRGF